MYTEDETLDRDDCMNRDEACQGAVEYREALSGSGERFPRCDFHWDERLDVEQGIRERYPDHAPSDWSAADAGESWYDDY